MREKEVYKLMKKAKIISEKIGQLEVLLDSLNKELFKTISQVYDIIEKEDKRKNKKELPYIDCP